MSGDPFSPLGGGQSAEPARRQGARRNVTLVPPHALTAPNRHPRLGQPSATWIYRDAVNSVLGYVHRFDGRDGDKSFRPLCLFEEGDELSWRWESWPAPRPLYGIDRLAKHPDAPVVITEGEKAADAAGRLLTDHVAVTSPGGSKSAGKSDWSPLAGRAVFIWPDKDDAGVAYADDVAASLGTVGVSSLAIISPPDSATEGWDAADALQEGWTGGQTVELIASAKPIHVSKGKMPARNARRGKRGVNCCDDTTTGRKPPRQRDSLVDAASEAKLWHSPDRTAYASVPMNGHLEHWRLDSKPFAMWLGERHYRSTGSAPTTQQLNDAIRILEVKAIHHGPRYQPMRRIGWHDGASWLDLCDDQWRAIRIDADGWRVETNPPVKFLRSQTMAALPEPEGGHLIEELRGFVNAGDDDFRLIVAWLVAALWGAAEAFPILALGGEQGSGKTTMARLLRSLVDPSTVPTLSPPRDERDLVILAANAHVLSFDNVSGVPNWLSDAVCRLATGSGFATRKLHSDDDLTWFHGARPCILNGIPSLTDRADLAERSLTVRLLRIGEGERRAEDEWWLDWDQARPGMLGALCDALSSAMRRYDQVKLTGLPRMASFAKLMEAASPGLGWEPGEFMASYDGNRRATNEMVFEANPVAVAIAQFMETQPEEDNRWEGTATELLDKLNTIAADDIRRSRFWPVKPNAMGNAVDRAAPVLRGKGIAIDRHKASDRRLIIITMTG